MLLSSFPQSNGFVCHSLFLFKCEKKIKMSGRTWFHPVRFHWTMKSGRSTSEWSLNANLQRMQAQIFRGAIFDSDMKAEGQVHSWEFFNVSHFSNLSLLFAVTGITFTTLILITLNCFVNYWHNFRGEHYQEQYTETML